jgi:hypothetical protein
MENSNSHDPCARALALFFLSLIVVRIGIDLFPFISHAFLYIIHE